MARIKITAGVASVLAIIQLISATPSHGSIKQDYCPVIYTDLPTSCHAIPETFLSFSSKASNPPPAETHVLEDALSALSTLQDTFFEPDYATWPSAIDWTAAVAGTVTAGMLTTLSKAINTVDLAGIDDWRVKENVISTFYAQLVGSYFGQDVLSLRAQAYDDILWVVLGWIEAIKFVNTHAGLHYPKIKSQGVTPDSGLRDVIDAMPWQGYTWLSSFAHRSRIFWNLATHGWDTTLCNGGMLWNNRPGPYKNAITNELWVAASISMYEHFPGDNFTAPWLSNAAFPDNDPAHLEAAMEGYKWLTDVNMTNSRGLFVDGYHIDSSKPGNTKCDLRNEMVYTYNQGVLLTGQRGLWSVSGSVSYLEDGHRLIQSVIEATGWNLKDDKPMDDLSRFGSGKLPPWRGLGRGGILEEKCDEGSTCNQDAQIFKGIFFHHFTAFCTPLEPLRGEKGRIIDTRGFKKARSIHAEACQSYLGWVRHNAQAALDTRDNSGLFGMWWGAGIFGGIVASDNNNFQHNSEITADGHNQGKPGQQLMDVARDGVLPRTRGLSRRGLEPQNQDANTRGLGRTVATQNDTHRVSARGLQSQQQDPNTRGRGRTLETQVGGIAVLRAYWELSRAF